jgi:D-mannonate dehydratase
MEEVILEAVRRMNNYLKDIVTVEILDTQMSRKYPDNYAPSGYLGVSVLITCNKKQHRVFLKYSEAENMITYSHFIDGFLGEFVKDDLEQILKNYYRKIKLEQLSERIEFNDNE